MMALRPLLSICLAALACCGTPAHARSGCVDDARDDSAGAGWDESVPGDGLDAHAMLQGLVRDALNRSQGAGANRLPADAVPRAIDAHRAGHAAGAPLSMREQLAMNTVSLALERSRYRQHVVIYGQYVRRMACLAEALETQVRADRGRAAELVQAQQALLHAQELQADAQALARQVDVRLRRLVGDGLPGVQGLSTVLLRVEALSGLIADVEGLTEIGQTTARRAAATVYGRALADARKPEVSWAFTGAGAPAVGSNPDTPGGRRGAGIGRSGNLSVGLAVHIPLYSPGLAPASGAARRRAEAARQQRDDALEARRYRVAEVHEQTLAGFERARRVGALLRDSEQLHNRTLKPWRQLGRNGLFDMLGTEADHYQLRVAYVDALHDGQQLNAMLLSLGRGVQHWLQ